MNLVERLYSPLMRTAISLYRLLHGLSRSVPISREAHIFTCGMSRSGTTLLATIFDSHPDISMGYELVPARFGSIMEIDSEVRAGIAAGNTPDALAKDLKKRGRRDIALFLRRCQRAGVGLEQILQVTEDMKKQNQTSLRKLRDRFAMAYRVIATKQQQARTRYSGFKANTSDYLEVAGFFPNSYFVYILRDPRDVVASHLERGFERTVEEISRNWVKSLEGFLALREKYPEQSLLFRYEDLVSDPATTIGTIFSVLPLEVSEEVFNFYRSKASVHREGHPNAENLKRDFFTTSTARWKNDLSTEQLETTARICGSRMRQYAYL